MDNQIEFDANKRYVFEMDLRLNSPTTNEALKILNIRKQDCVKVKKMQFKMADQQEDITQGRYAYFLNLLHSLYTSIIRERVKIVKTRKQAQVEAN